MPTTHELGGDRAGGTARNISHFKEKLHELDDQSKPLVLSTRNILRKLPLAGYSETISVLLVIGKLCIFLIFIHA